MKVLNTDIKSGFASHVLLAGCSSEEVAHEVDGRGRFTLALTNLLRDPSVRTDMTTYQDIIKLLPDLPQCVPLSGFVGDFLST